MSMMISKVFPSSSSLLLLLLLALISFQAGKVEGGGRGHSDGVDANLFSEDWTYVEYPAEAQPLLDEKTKRLAPIAPMVRLIETLPEGHAAWMNLQATAIRNSVQNDIFKSEAIYAIKDGFTNGCNPAHSHVNYDQDWCTSHCTHKGRYCPAELPEDLAEKTKHQGKDLMKEILRRLCLDKIVKSSDFKWFDYLRNFEVNDCFQADDLTACSKKSLSKAKIDYDSVIGECVKEEELDTDTTSDLLEEQLAAFKDLPYTLNDLPILEIGGDRFPYTFYRDDKILETWCSKFPADDQPVGCDFCDKCNYEKACLWTLICDKHEFSLDDYQAPIHTKAPTPAPMPEPEFLLASASVGILIGLLCAGMCYAIAHCRRQRAVKEVAGTLPTEGFRDGDNYSFSDKQDKDVELPKVS